MIWESLLGAAVILLTALGLLLVTRKARTGKPLIIRMIPEISRLRRALGLSVEAGSRVHIGLGNSPITDPASTTSLSGLNALYSLGQASSTSDHPPLATSGDGAFSLLSKEVLRAVSAETNTRDLFDPDHGALTGITPFSYAMGTLDRMRDPALQTNILVGNFGPEAGFLTVRSEETGRFTLAVSDSLVGQSVFYATCRDALIGEELFALPAYLAETPAHLVSLRIQDNLRLLVCLALIAGAILKVLGIL